MIFTVFVVLPVLIVTVYLPVLLNFKAGAAVVFPATEVVLMTVIERPVGSLIAIHTSVAAAVAGKTS